MDLLSSRLKGLGMVAVAWQARLLPQDLGLCPLYLQDGPQPTMRKQEGT